MGTAVMETSLTFVVEEPQMAAIAKRQQSQPVEARSIQERLDELLEDFLAGLDVRASSRATYERQLRQFRSWLALSGRMARLDSLQFDRTDILAYRAWLQEGKGSYTVNGYLTAVRKFFSWLEAQKLYPNVAKVKGLKKPKGHRKDTLTKLQLREMLAGIDRSSLEGLRDYALINLMARTGLRDVEVSRALLGDIRQEAGQAVLWVQGKGRDSKDEFVLLLDEAYEPIWEYLRARGAILDEEPLFCSHSDRNRGQALSTRSISRAVKEALRAIGLDNARLTAHSLRHTAITMAILGGASPVQTQAMARHSDINTTMGYYHNLARVQAGAEKCISF